jgi:hypothetical protein
VRADRAVIRPFYPTPHPPPPSRRPRARLGAAMGSRQRSRPPIDSTAVDGTLVLSRAIELETIALLKYTSELALTSPKNGATPSKKA